MNSKATINIFTILLLVGLAPFTMDVRAESDDTKPAASTQSSDSLWTRDKLLGDAGGVRSTLAKHGIDIDLRLSQYYQGVASGGKDENSEYGGTMDYRANIDLNKLIGTWEGFSVSVHARTRFGEDVSGDAGAFVLENTGMLMPAPDNYHNTDVTGLLVNQYLPLGENHLGLLSLGKIDVIDAVSLFFPSVSYGQEGFWNVNSMVSALPWFGAVEGLSLYGGWAATINKEYQIGQSAILVTGTENVSDNLGQRIRLFRRRMGGRVPQIPL